jgi:NDP-sugar pyrophosphorylase family protein
MKAMILAAGFGTRLRPLTDTLPKPLLPVGNRPLIHYNLLLLKKYGITDVLINLHHHGERIVREVGNGLRFGMNVIYSEEPTILGTGGAIKKVRSEVADGAFLVINGDILVDINLDKAVEFHHRKKGVATLILREDEEVDRYGPVEIDAKNRIRNILGKCCWNGEKLNRLMFTGIHIVEPKALDYVPQDLFYSITDAYIEMVRRGEKLYGYVMKGYWTDIGVIERYRRVDQDLKDGKIKLSYVRP